MSGMFGGGSKGVDTSGLNIMAERARDTLANFSKLGRKELERGKQELSANGVLEQLYGDSLGRYQGLDDQIASRRQEAYDANFNPIMQSIQTDLSNKFAGLGQGGRRNSRGQFALARYGRELADTGSQRLINAQNQAENQAIGALNNRSNPIFGLQGQNVGLTQGIANNYMNTGMQLANQDMQRGSTLGNMAMQNAQMANQNRNNSKNSVGSLAGGGLGLASSFFSDRRLKENIQAVGKLDNGLTVYSYNYKGTPGTQLGLMADEVEKVNPGAVSTHVSGYQQVNYAEAIQ